jgi:hypothetical protein
LVVGLYRNYRDRRFSLDFAVRRGAELTHLLSAGFGFE